MGFLDRRLDSHAADLEVAVSALGAYGTALEGARPVTSPVSDEGMALAAAVRAKRADLKEMKAWQATARALLQQWDLARPGALDSYAAQLPDDDAKLIRSMRSPKGTPAELAPHLLEHEGRAMVRSMEGEFRRALSEQPGVRSWETHFLAGIGATEIARTLIRTDPSTQYWRPLGVPEPTHVDALLLAGRFVATDLIARTFVEANPVDFDANFAEIALSEASQLFARDDDAVRSGSWIYDALHGAADSDSKMNIIMDGLMSGRYPSGTGAYMYLLAQPLVADGWGIGARGAPSLFGDLDQLLVDKPIIQRVCKDALDLVSVVLGDIDAAGGFDAFAYHVLGIEEQQS